MTTYNFKSGEERVKGILKRKIVLNRQHSIPHPDIFSSDEYCHGWTTAIFIDLRTFVLLGKLENDKIAKIIRCLTSEIVRILADDTNVRDIGFRDDSVYAVYTTPEQVDIYHVIKRATSIMACGKMINRIFEKEGFPKVNVGAGVFTAEELAVKFVPEDWKPGTNVWVGNAVKSASNLAFNANKHNVRAIVISEHCYKNFIKAMIDEYPKAKSWFKSHGRRYGQAYYSTSLVDPDYYDWAGTFIDD